MKDKVSNTIKWSPRGRHLILANLFPSTKFEIEFWDLDFSLEDRREGAVAKEEWGSNVQLFNTVEHYGVTDVDWDPSGRCVATSASAWRPTVSSCSPSIFRLI